LKGDDLPEYFIRKPKEEPATCPLNIKISRIIPIKSESMTNMKSVKMIKTTKDGKILKVVFSNKCNPSNRLGSKIKSKISQVIKIRPRA
jgi:pyruvoyl-dependent arginine decarboxylase (PvlArgDC)